MYVLHENIIYIIRRNTTRTVLNTKKHNQHKFVENKEFSNANFLIISTYAYYFYTTKIILI